MEALPESDWASQRRRWKRFAWIGAILLACPLLGLAGTVVGMMMSFQRIETMKAPTPGDLAEGVNFSLYSALVGALLGGIGAVLFTIALIRLGRLGDRPPSGSGGEPWT